MTPAERQKLFRAERARQWKLGVDLKVRTRETVLSLLDAAATNIAARLAGEPSEWEAYRLPLLQTEVRRQMSIFQGASSEALIGGLRDGWDLGQALIDAPLKGVGIDLASALPRLNSQVLLAMQSFATDRIADIATSTVNKVNAELAQVIMGTQTPFQAAGKVVAHLGKDSPSASRATTIVNDEVGRAYSLAGQERMLQAKAMLPGLRKQWRRSGKREARVAHMMADGQVVKVNEPFLIGGHKLMCPRDPAAPIGQTINCGCTSLPIMKSWEVMHPAEMPFSDQEIATNRDARTVQDARQQDLAQTARQLVADLAAGKARPQGRFFTAGQIDPQIQKVLAQRGHKLATVDIALGDRQIVHMQRQHKKARGAAVPPELIEQLPDILSRPLAVFLEEGKRGPSLHYMAQVPNDPERAASFIVHLRQKNPSMRHSAHNWVETASMVTRKAVASNPALIKVVGAV